MTFFRISVGKMSGENSHCNEENTVKMIQRLLVTVLCSESDVLAWVLLDHDYSMWVWSSFILIHSFVTNSLLAEEI